MSILESSHEDPRLASMRMSGDMAEEEFKQEHEDDECDAMMKISTPPPSSSDGIDGGYASASATSAHHWPDNDVENYLDDSGSNASRRLSPAQFASTPYPPSSHNRYYAAEQQAGGGEAAAAAAYETKYCPPPSSLHPAAGPYNYNNYNYARPQRIAETPPHTGGGGSGSQPPPPPPLNNRHMIPPQTHPPYAGTPYGQPATNGSYGPRNARLHPGHGPGPYPPGYGPGMNASPRPTYNPAMYPHQFPNMWYPNSSYAAYGGAPSPAAVAPSPYGAYGPSSSYGGDHRTHHNYHHGHGDRYGRDPMIDMLQMSNSGREARNRAEKNRRDKLNGSIQELSTLVPHVAESPKRVDKTAVLRFAAHGLRLQHVFGRACPQEPRSMQVSDALMKLLDSFFITLTCHGQIVLISRSVEQHLGHCQSDLYGQNILHITHPEDHNMIKQMIIPTDLDALLEGAPAPAMDTGGDEDGPRMRTKAEEDYIDQRLREDKRSFTVRLARAGPRSEPTTYEVVKIDGIFRRSDAAPRGVRTNTYPSTLQLIRRTRRDDASPLHTISGNDIVLVAIARIIRPPKIIDNMLEGHTLEYKTRHLIDGRIVDCDQRVGIVAGYMVDEIRNLSPFTFIHQDDVRWVIVALRQMYDCNSSYGESTYRLLTRNGTFIYLQTKGFLEIDKATNQVHSFVCVNTLLDEAEGKKRVQEMKNKFSVIINAKIPHSRHDAPASEDPQQLERAVLCLIENLQKSPSDDEDNGVAGGYERVCIEEIHQQQGDDEHASAGVSGKRMPLHHHHHHHQHTSMRASKTPPLALVPPETDSVKSSISKSVSVVNVTAAKHLRDSQNRVKSPLANASPSKGGDEVDIGAATTAASTSPNKRKREYTLSGGECNAEESAAKRRLNSNEMDDLDHSMQQQPQHPSNPLEGGKFVSAEQLRGLDDLLGQHQTSDGDAKGDYPDLQLRFNGNNNDIMNTITDQQQPPLLWQDEQGVEDEDDEAAGDSDDCDEDDDDDDDDVEYANALV